MKTIALLGMGAMGSRMAENILAQGYTLHIYNRTPKSCEALVAIGATAFATPKQAVINADVIIAMLSNDEASQEVWLNKDYGALTNLKSGAIAIECSTLSLDWCYALSDAMKQKHIAFLDAPIVGSRPQAEAGQLIHLVGGKEKTFQRVKKLLSSSANAFYHIGENTKGMAMKLAVNGLFATQVAALSEIITMLENVGINRQQAITTLNELPITSPALKGIGLMSANNNYQPLFPINLVEKDLSYLLKIPDLPTIDSVRNSYKKAIGLGLGEDNINGLVKLYKK